jgi:predicted MPP superfamily phosphohydrolase
MVLITRRRFVFGTAALSAAALADAFLVEPSAIDVSRHDIAVPGLPPGLAGVRIACLTDVHLEGGVSPAARAALAVLARERPDVVMLIGDICNRLEDLPTLVAWARDGRGTVATFATLGNWEHSAKIDRATAERAYGQAGVELLYNSAGRVSVCGATLSVVGLDDPVYGTPDPAAAVKDVRTGEPVVWVLHGPGYVDGIARDGYPVPAAIFAGHTHGGQIRMPFWTPYTPYGSGRFVAGWYRDTFAPLYVSRGIGTITVRARLFCTPELPIFTLKREQGAGSGT